MPGSKKNRTLASVWRVSFGRPKWKRGNVCEVLRDLSFKFCGSSYMCLPKSRDQYGGTRVQVDIIKRSTRELKLSYFYFVILLYCYVLPP